MEEQQYYIQPDILPPKPRILTSEQSPPIVEYSERKYDEIEVNPTIDKRLVTPKRINDEVVVPDNTMYSRDTEGQA